ncbi:hypothetical protein [Aquibium sp. ELW1220]|uniref:hypothetical protein n=1 Tax=Aquibium sp. ELW1220 TaxID=2976766 RepID=UPI0025B215D1|nr:hypothetical protein [Aquibium sp. ELW1220]MDN2581605.1 hypothetical protein [Aquibium sp. ELW1220]
MIPDCRSVTPLVALFLASAALPSSGSRAIAHDAASGWSYPLACCSGFDCRQVSAARVAETPDGYVIASTGEVVGYADGRIRTSPDGEFHWCSVAGADDGDTICLFVPPKLF